MIEKADLNEDLEQEERIKRREQLYRDLFQTDMGEEVIRDLLSSSSMMTPSIGDHAEMAFVEGQRSAVATIMSLAGYQITPTPAPREGERHVQSP